MIRWNWLYDDVMHINLVYCYGSASETAKKTDEKRLINNGDALKSKRKTLTNNIHTRTPSVGLRYTYYNNIIYIYITHLLRYLPTSHNPNHVKR